MKIKKNTFSTLALELFFPSIANSKKLKIQKIQKSTPPSMQDQTEATVSYMEHSMKPVLLCKRSFKKHRNKKKNWQFLIWASTPTFWWDCPFNNYLCTQQQTLLHYFRAKNVNCFKSEISYCKNKFFQTLVSYVFIGRTQR
jgi:hypothetical protein